MGQQVVSQNAGILVVQVWFSYEQMVTIIQLVSEYTSSQHIGLGGIHSEKQIITVISQECHCVYNHW